MGRRTRKRREKMEKKLSLKLGNRWLRYESDALRAALKQSEGVTATRLFNVYWCAYLMAYLTTRRQLDSHVAFYPLTLFVVK
jgi:hypothetical protein